MYAIDKFLEDFEQEGIFNEKSSPQGKPNRVYVNHKDLASAFREHGERKNDGFYFGFKSSDGVKGYLCMYSRMPAYTRNPIFANIIPYNMRFRMKGIDFANLRSGDTCFQLLTEGGEYFEEEQKLATVWLQRALFSLGLRSARIE